MCLLSLSVTALAQPPENELRSNLAGVRYSPLAEAARIQGDVRLEVTTGIVTLLSGHPLLARTAMESAAVLGSIRGPASVTLTYHFVLVDKRKTAAMQMTLKKGDALDRIILRALRLKTNKIVVQRECQQQGAPPANELRSSEANIEIWIYGRIGCLQTETASLIAQRRMS
jgi:hypothetical protein